MDIDKLICRIRADGMHPDDPSPECLLELMPPFEFVDTTPEDRIGLRTEFAVDKLLLRYVRGSLGKETEDVRRVLVEIAWQFVRSCSVDAARESMPEFYARHAAWVRNRLMPSEKRIDEVLHAIGSGLKLPSYDDDELEPAFANWCYAIADDCFGIDERRDLAQMRHGIALHLANQRHLATVPSDLKREAAKALPEDAFSASDYFAFLERGVPGQVSVLRIDDQGVSPDPLRVKTRLDSLAGRQKPDSHEHPMDEKTPEPIDQSAIDAAEVLVNAQHVRALLERIRDREKPGSSRRIVAEAMLSGEMTSIQALSKSTGRAFEGLRRADEQIKVEISNLM